MSRVVVVDEETLAALVRTSVEDATATLAAEVNALKSAVAVLASNKPQAEKVYLTTAEAAELLGVCTKTVKRWVDTGALPHVRLPGGGIRVSVAELERVLHRAEAGLEAAE
ncbi:MAG: helix-turn-helix domain-containing protein [Polyangiaceae bacterium]|nr:helix-turn-helix domain-containing protein [Polyangiaceae bacterium]